MRRSIYNIIALLFTVTCIYEHAFFSFFIRCVRPSKFEVYVITIFFSARTNTAALFCCAFQNFLKLSRKNNNNSSSNNTCLAHNVFLPSTLLISFASSSTFFIIFPCCLLPYSISFTPFPVVYFNNLKKYT